MASLFGTLILSALSHVPGTPDDTRKQESKQTFSFYSCFVLPVRLLPLKLYDPQPLPLSLGEIYIVQVRASSNLEQHSNKKAKFSQSSFLLRDAATRRGSSQKHVPSMIFWVFLHQDSGYAAPSLPISFLASPYLFFKPTSIRGIYVLESRKRGDRGCVQFAC